MQTKGVKKLHISNAGIDICWIFNIKLKTKGKAV